MGQETKIEWCDHTFNPWTGCAKVSPGCKHCYAEGQSKRNTSPFGQWGKGQPRKRTSEAYWAQARRWDREAQAFWECDACHWRGHETNGMCPACEQGLMTRVRPRVFCASMADWLDPDVPLEWLADLLDLIRITPHLDWLLLTKRPELWRQRIERARGWQANEAIPFSMATSWLNGYPPANVWIGTSVEDQQWADERIPHLLSIRAKVRFLSMEPLLGPVELPQQRLEFSVSGSPLWPPPAQPGIVALPHKQWPDDYVYWQAVYNGIHWVIVGGESGPHARPMHPDWARSLRDQCQDAGVPFFFKQWGEYVPCITDDFGDGIVCLPDGADCASFEDESKHPMLYAHERDYWRVGKKAAGRMLDGREWSQFPEAEE